MEKGAIILCGGQSSRMGRDKATLPFGSETMLQRVVRLVSEAIEPANIIVVAAPSQALPVLPSAVTVARDTHEYLGPLAGLATGLPMIAERTGAMFVTGCDVPLLVPAIIERLFELLGDFDIAVPFDDQYPHPLAAVYRTALLPHVQQLLDAHCTGPRFLFDEVCTRMVHLDELRAVDPQLLSLVNVNDEQSYHAALAAAGFSAPTDPG